ncbi:MAG: HAD hydrolase family protein [Rikenellaceae bacterium]
MGNFKEDIALCKALVLDVDGVLTDGGITPTRDGDFIRTYNAKDGYAVAYAIKMGYPVCVITGGRGANLEYRLKMLGIKEMYIECMDKMAALNDFMRRYSITADQIIYMGDDIPDLECMRAVGVAVAPRDAAMEVVEVARYVSEFDGGRGCVRDIVEQWLRSHGKWALHSYGVTGREETEKSERA